MEKDREPEQEAGSSSEDFSEDEDMLQGPAGGADEEWDEWQSDDGGCDDEPAHSLFSPGVVLPSPEAAFEHDRKQHGFDLRQYAVQARLDDYGILRVINFIRAEVKAGRDPKPTLAAYASAAAAAQAAPEAPWDADSFLVPVLPEDSLLTYDYEDALAGMVATEQPQQGAQQPSSQGTNTAVSEAAEPGVLQLPAAAAEQMRALRAENRSLKEEVEVLKGLLSSMRQALLPEELQGEQQEAGTGAASTSTSAAGAGTPAAAAQQAGGASTSAAAQAAGAGADAPGNSTQPADPKAAAKQEIDESYFDSYSGFKIHQEMLSDKPRTDAYRDALEKNPSIVKGKAVLDVGCGTGILSMFAARAGAKVVVGVDGSDRIAGFARKNAAQNGYAAEQGGPMHVVASRIEQLAQLPGGVEKVDVIVSEWMGYALLFETMLDSVLTARDRWLAPGGVVLPDVATIYLAGASAAAMGTHFWKDVYGFKMDAIAEEVEGAMKARANVVDVPASSLTTSTATVKVLDMCTMRPEDQDFTTEFVLTGCDSSSGCDEVAAIVLWFDTAFSKERCPETAVLLSTSPHAPLTHWAQTVLALRTPVKLARPGAAGAAAAADSAREIRGRISMARNRDKHRSLDIALTYKAELGDGRVVEEAGVYAMSVLG